MRERLRQLPAGLSASAVLLVVAVTVGWIVRGPVAAVGAALGVLLVVVSYVLSGLVVAWTDLFARHLMMPVVLLTYALKATLLGLVLYQVDKAGWPGLFALGVAAVAAVVVWVGAQLAWAIRTSNRQMNSLVVADAAD